MKTLTTLILAAAMALFALPAGAVGVGHSVPSPFNAVDDSGAPRTFDSLTGENGAVLVFTRSADWCPYCKVQLIDLNAAAAQFEERGFSLVSVSYDSPQTLASFRTQRGITYTLLSDQDSALIRAFGILNTDISEDSRAYGIPHPTIYVVRADGTISAILAEEGYKKRPGTEEILNAVDGSIAQ